MALDADDLKKIGELIAGAIKPETIGEAVKAHIGALKLEDTVKASVEAALKARADAEPDPADKDGKKGKDGKSSEADARVAKLEKDIAAEREARETAENGRKADALNTAARDALAKAGIPADRIKHAMASLGVDGVLTYDAAGKPGWKGKDKYGTDAVLDIEAGATEWAASAAGKVFSPPTNAQGSGERPGGNGRHVDPTVRDAAGNLDSSKLLSRVMGNLAQQ